MHPALTRYMGKVPTVCATCRRRAAGFGYSPRPHAISNIDLALQLAILPSGGKKFYAMSAQQFDEYELGAMLEAGRNAGSYLDEIGKTDLKLLERRGMARIPVPTADRIRAGPAPQIAQRRTAASDPPPL